MQSKQDLVLKGGRKRCEEWLLRLISFRRRTLLLLPWEGSGFWDPASDEHVRVIVQLLFSSGPKVLKDSDPDRGGCWALLRKVIEATFDAVLPPLTNGIDSNGRLL